MKDRLSGRFFVLDICEVIKDYASAVDYLYSALPMYQRIGAAAFKKDLTNTLLLCESLGNPERKFKSIHIAGTNGKGSTSHMLAAILQEAGYRTGLYTSPHLKSFTERIRVNGLEVPEAFVVDFVNRLQPVLDRVKPSFFEMTVAMAFDYFATEGVDVAVVEVGLGGRLDSTNVITPVLSVITNISYDHQDMLGDTLAEIAGEKAGIIKPGVPVVISQHQDEVKDVFVNKARATVSTLSFSESLVRVEDTGDHLRVFRGNHVWFDALDPELTAGYQRMNVQGVLASVLVLRDAGFKVDDESVQKGIEGTCRITGLKGRWQIVGHNPLVICDTGHNEAGIREVVRQIAKTPHERLFIVLGMVKEKDSAKVLKLLPVDARYFFCQAKIPRAKQAIDLQREASVFGLQGIVIEDVNEAIEAARHEASKSDLIFVGGSTFVVAEVNEL